MPIVKAADYVEAYRARALAADVNELSGRTGRRDLTDFVAGNIVGRMQAGPG